MSGLVLIVATAHADRAHAAFSIAAAAAATGHAVRLYLHEGAALLLTAASGDGDTHRRAAGLPGLREMLAEALDLGVAIVACQSGLALAEIDAARLDPRIETGGLIGMMQSLGDDRLTVI